MTNQRDMVLVAIVKTPRDFEPEAWDEFPRSGKVVGFGNPVHRGRAEGAIFAFNEFSIRSRERVWAVLMDPDVEPSRGAKVWRQMPHFEA